MITTLKDLEKLLKLCRKQGITEIELLGTKVKFGDLPASSIPGMELVEDENPYENFPQGELTPEQLMFYSSGGRPEDDPELKVS